MDLFQRGNALSRREKRFATFAEVSALGVDAATFHREGGRDWGLYVFLEILLEIKRVRPFSLSRKFLGN